MTAPGERLAQWPDAVRENATPTEPTNEGASA